MPVERRLTLGEGNTPLVPAPTLAERCGLDRLYLKREDLNPTGSHKDRGAAYQISVEAMGGAAPAEAELPSSGPAWLVISSSGNAAIAAAAYARQAGIGLAACVDPETPVQKLAPLTRLGAAVLLSPRALSLAEEISQLAGVPNLRPSTHPLAVDGYLSLGWEIAADASGSDAIFTFVSSGASFVGLARALATQPSAARLGFQLHAVQPAGAAPISAEDDPDRAAMPRGVVGMLGARKTRRVGEAKRAMLTSGGRGWVVTDAEALEADEWLTGAGVLTSLEGAASLAAAARAAKDAGVRSAVVILTGHFAKRHDSTAPNLAAQPIAVSNAEEAVAILARRWRAPLPRPKAQ